MQITRVVASVSNVSVLRRFLNVVVSSRYCHSNVSVSSRSQHHMSHLHRTSKFELITSKSPILLRYLSHISISVENIQRFFWTVNCFTLALKNTNVMDMTKELIFISFCLWTTDKVSRWKHYRQSIVFITKSLNFKPANVLIFSVNYSWCMAQAQSDTSSKPNLKLWITGVVAD